MTKKVALLVAIREIDSSFYQNIKIAIPCIKCRSDIFMIEKILKSLGYQTNTIKNKYATFDNILQIIKNFSKILTEGDTFVFYFTYEKKSDYHFIKKNISDTLWLSFKKGVTIVIISDTFEQNHSLPFLPSGDKDIYNHLEAKLIHLKGYKNKETFTEILYKIWKNHNFTENYPLLVQKASKLITFGKKPQYYQYGKSFKITQTPSLPTDQIPTECTEYNKIMLKEIHHRIKNNLNTIASIIGLQILNLKEGKEESTEEILRKSKLRIEAISLVHESLYKSGDLKKIDFKQYIIHLTNLINRTYDRNINVEINAQQISLSSSFMLNIGIIINELFTNSIKYAIKKNDKKNAIIIELKKEKNRCILHYHEKYNKKIDINSLKTSKTLGIKLVNLLVKQLKADMKISKSAGLLFTITFNCP